jgi:hypothetical protein
MDYDTFDGAPLEFKKKLIANFIENTIEYANDHIKQRQSELSVTDAAELEQKTLRIVKWLGYIEFQRHTLGELETDKLDRFILKLKGGL